MEVAAGCRSTVSTSGEKTGWLTTTAWAGAISPFAFFAPVSFCFDMSKTPSARPRIPLGTY
jgi:hypothetical protein